MACPLNGLTSHRRSAPTSATTMRTVSQGKAASMTLCMMLSSSYSRAARAATSTITTPKVMYEAYVRA